MIWRSEIIRRLMAKRLISGECWIHTSVPNSDGYCNISLKNRKYYVHRVSAFLWLGLPLNSGLLVRHVCVDKRRCFNPDHLAIGTHFDNNRDIIADDRQNPDAITKKDVISLVFAVRRGDLTIPKWARGAGVSYSTALKAYAGNLHAEWSEAAHRIADKAGLAEYRPEKKTKRRKARDYRTDPAYIAANEESELIPF